MLPESLLQKRVPLRPHVKAFQNPLQEQVILLLMRLNRLQVGLLHLQGLQNRLPVLMSHLRERLNRLQVGLLHLQLGLFHLKVR